MSGQWDTPEGCKLNDPKAPWNEPNWAKMAEEIEEAIRDEGPEICCDQPTQLTHHENGVWWTCMVCGDLFAGYSLEGWKRVRRA